MNEYETDPQRPPANADREPSPHTAELPRVDSGQSDSGVPDTGPAGPGRAEPDAAPTGPGSAPRPTPPSAAPASGQPYGAPPAGGQPPYGAAPATGQPYQPAPSTGQPYGASPEAPGPYAPSPWHPAHAGHQPQGGWTGNTASFPGHPQGPGGYGEPYGPNAAMPPNQPHAGGGPLPPWAQGPARPTGSGRLGRIAAIGAAALVLMAGSGIAGGVVALAVDDGGSGSGPTYTAAPVLDSADLPGIAARVQNSVVSISTGSGGGSGVVLTADGYVLTNNHVVASGTGDTVRVVFANGKSANAKIVGTDPKTDLAVVKADGLSGLTAATFGDSDAMQVGDTVLALGSPLGLQGSVTAGIISARDRTIQASDQEPDNPFQRPQQDGVSSISGLLQTDAPINPGNSGGALINTNAEVIGINTAIATAGQSSGNIGVGFAIPSNKAKAVAEALRRGEKISHPSLGVSVQPAENGGALVGSVRPDSPAAKVGLQQGDVITRFGDKTINDSKDLVAAVQGGKVGDQVQMTYTRNGVEKTATVTLAETS